MKSSRIIPSVSPPGCPTTSCKLTTQCPRCGGHGYLKTSPGKYHTCLVCLGKGHIAEKTGS